MIARPLSGENVKPLRKPSLFKERMQGAGQYVIDHGAEWNYIIGVPLNYVMAYTESIPVTAGSGITLGWNYLDAVYQLGLGIQQMTNQTDYRQTELKIKGALNILSGLQMMVFTYNPALTAALGLAGGAALAGPSFVFAMMCDVVTTLIDFCHAQKEVNIKRWFSERGKELAFYNKKITELNRKITDAKAAQRRAGFIHSLEKQLDLFKNKKQIAQDELAKRARVYCYTNKYSTELYQHKQTFVLNAVTSAGYQDFNLDAICKKPDSDEDIIVDGKYVDKDVEAAETAWDATKQKDLEKERNTMVFNLALRTASLIGMTILAVSAFVACPYLMPIGFAVVTLVATIYLIRNSKEIGEAINSKLKGIGLFKPKQHHEEMPVSARLKFSLVH